MGKYQYFNLSNGDIVQSYFNSNISTIPFNYSQIDDYLNNNQIVHPLYKIYILNPDESIKFEIPQEDILLDGSYSENYQNGQRRSLSFSLYNQTGKYNPSINNLWIGTKIKFEVGISYNETALYFSKGVYNINSIDPREDVAQKIVSIQCGDKWEILDGNVGRLDSGFEINVGEDIEEIIKTLLLAQKGNGDPIDPKDIIYHSSFKGKTTQVKISKSSGETIGSLIADLATQLSAEYFYNTLGNLTFLPLQESIDDIDKPIIAHLKSKRGELTPLSFSLSYNEVVNRIIVTGGTVNGKLCKGIAENNKSESPLCIQRIGSRTAQIVNDSNITSDILAQERADYELRQQLILKSSVSTTTYFNPLLSVNNLISIVDDFFDLKEEKFLLQSISFSLNYDGTNSITFSNISNLPFIYK